MAMPAWGPGPPSLGPLTLTPLQLEPSLPTVRLSWEMGAQSPSRLDSGQAGGRWGCPRPPLDLRAPAYERMESLPPPPPLLLPQFLAFELERNWSRIASALLGVQVR